MTPNAKRKLIHYWRRHIRPILVLILVFTAFRSTMADWNDVPSGSMEPTIFIGDRIFVNKLAYGLKVPFTTIHLAHWSGPERGEVVVFYSPEDGTRLVKRVVGIPGDHIELKNGFLTINGQPVTYTPATPGTSAIPAEQQRGFQFYTEQLGGHPHTMAMINNPSFANARNRDYVVPADHYFMMGDNRDNSKDSRFFKDEQGNNIPFVPRDQILGRANRVVFSLDRGDYWLPRANRFFHALP